MENEVLHRLLLDVAEVRITPDEAAEKMKTLPYDDIGFAKLDTHRALRTGRGEVVFGIGKTPGQVAEIMKRLSASAPLVIATKVGPEFLEAARDAVPGIEYFETARLLAYRAEGAIQASGGTGNSNTTGQNPGEPCAGRPDGGPQEPGRSSAAHIAVVCAGTADIPVAEEAAVTSELYGIPAERYYDVGVAGIHRLLDKAADIRRAGAIIVVAGMEGALASVVGGFSDAPVVAVPTSIGYGASMGGFSALLTMLNSCSLGVSVVNIDNGFGAGYIASMIVKGKEDGG